MATSMLVTAALATSETPTSASEISTDSSPSPSPSPSPPSEVLHVKKQTLQSRDWRPSATLHQKPPSSYTFYERIAARGLMQESYHDLKPASLNRGPIPKHSTWREHGWILSRAGATIVIQQLSYSLFPRFKWPVFIAYPIYVISFAIFLIACVRRFDYWASVYGTFDEKVIGRDRMPDAAIPHLARSFMAFILLRVAGEFSLTWDSEAQPFSAFEWKTPIRMFIWLLTLDLFFYCYHRACHEVDFLWKVHSRHHTTKHPSPVLAILADSYQEVIEIVLCPLGATLVVPMKFHELYLMICYTAYVEILGHTGMRADWNLPLAGPILSFFGAELIVEDHDLHHRYGKSGLNYGKQTRVWDIIFGTCGERQETRGLPGHRET